MLVLLSLLASPLRLNFLRRTRFGVCCVRACVTCFGDVDRPLRLCRLASRSVCYDITIHLGIIPPLLLFAPLFCLKFQIIIIDQVH